MPLQEAAELMRRFHYQGAPEFAVAASRYFLSAGDVASAISALSDATKRRKQIPRPTFHLMLEPRFPGPFDFHFNRQIDRSGESDWLDALRKHADKMPDVMAALKRSALFRQTLNDGKPELARQMELMSQIDSATVDALVAYPVLRDYATWLSAHANASQEARESHLDVLSRREMARVGVDDHYPLDQLKSWALLNARALSKKIGDFQELHELMPSPALYAFHRASFAHFTRKSFSACVDAIERQGIPQDDAFHLANYLLLGFENQGRSHLVHAYYLEKTNPTK